MLSDIQQILAILAMGAIAWLIIVIVGIVCFCFPRRCEQCGKFMAFDSVIKWDTTQYHPVKGFIVSGKYFNCRTCLICGCRVYHRYTKNIFVTNLKNKVD